MLPSVDRPMLSVFNDKVLTQCDEGRMACYVTGIGTGGTAEMQFNLKFGRQDLGPLVSAHILSVYVVLVYQTHIFIYKENGDQLQV